MLTHASRTLALVGLLIATADRAAAIPQPAPAGSGPGAAAKLVPLDRGDDGWELDATIPVARFTGHSTYRIFAGNAAGGFTSELEFPLRGTLTGLHLRAGAPADADGTRWVVEGSVLHSLSGDAGQMKDSDWFHGTAETAAPPNGVGGAHEGKDIFSTSRASLRALVVDARVGRRLALAPALRLTPLAGVLYQRFAYAIRDLHQVGYGPFDKFYTVAVPGPVLSYKVQHVAPYLGARAEVTWRWVSAALDGWFSPLTYAHDFDDHLLRSKTLTATAFGNALQIAAEGRVALGDADHLSLQASYLRISTDGRQHQRFYAGANAGWTTTIAARLTSERATVLGAWTHRF